MTYNVIVTKFLEIPKNLFVQNYESEEAAISSAKENLLSLNGDYAVVVKVENGISKVIHRFEPIKK